MTLLEIDGLSIEVSTAGGGIELVHELSLTLQSGQTLCIVGESGSGKTVTALSIIRLLEFVAPVHTTGQIRLEGIDLTELTPEQMRSFRGGRIGMVFQEALDSLNPSQRIGSQLVEARRSDRGAERRARELLAEVGLPDVDRVMSSYPHQLSGGMQQRVMIAMALMSDPDVLLADEPTTALDVTTQAEILTLFRKVQRQHQMGCVFITHDMAVAAEIADRIAVLYAGRLVEVGAAQHILSAPRHRYTRALLECVPHAGVRRTAGLPSITGAVPSPGADLPGCRFAPRCEHVVTACTSTEPDLTPGPDPLDQAACWNPGDGPVLSPAAAAPVAEPNRDEDPPLLVVDRLKKTFLVRGRRGGMLGLRRSERLDAVDDVSLTIRPGEFFGLVGESGSGKTTLGQVVAALEDPTSGSSRLMPSAGDEDLPRGAPASSFEHTAKGLSGDVRAFRRQVQLIFQDPQSSLDPRHTVERIVAEPLVELTSLRRTERTERVRMLLDEVGLPEHVLNLVPSQLSGGQRQRVAIARAIAPQPQLIVADEPTSALDVSVQGQVMNLLLELRRERGLSYLFITHNLSLILSIADRIGVMKDGRLVEVADPETLIAAPRHEYTRTLIAANPALSLVPR
ncbi:ABC transporter ATP-binding protein [Phytoactinopolyspora limicola]|uniref:ABC transporter ATP-binding protein n=1 Tax=Phytoactinopolyspora limicola TaxID=2715536 RepID=UPI001409F915|nr:ABC transporter ATP-binding protein [Phytoactinopolyspora limicola]